MLAEILQFDVLGCAVRIRCEDPVVAAALGVMFGAHPGPRHRDAPARVKLDYRIARVADGYELHGTRASARAANIDELLYLFDKDLTVSLQHARSDLFFVHAAVVAWRGAAVMLVAASGGGKSTTAWALLHHGFSYLSDELAPIDPASLQVYAYPRALCLKKDPPPAYRAGVLPLRTASRCYLSPPADPVASAPLRAIMFLYYAPERSTPAVAPLAPAESAMRLYANALNPLAHPQRGLDAAIAITRTARCVELFSNDLGQTCALVERVLG